MRREFILPETALVSLPGRKHCSGELSTGRSSRGGCTALPGPALGCSEHPESSAERGWNHGGECFHFHTLVGWHVVGSERVAPSHGHKSKQVSFLFRPVSL